MNEDRLDNLVCASRVEGTGEVIENCIYDIKDIESRVKRYSKVHGLGEGRNPTDSGVLSQSEVAALLDELSSYRRKISLVIAIVNM